ncbi:MAG: DUF2835 domain-containing protein [Desulfobacteraceae bacterium]|nr:DUF2835 domain-containing protein [Desulfobacteraceae bacterium]
MPTAVIDINLPTDEVLKYYQGIATRVKGYGHTGEYMDLPINIFLNYISHDGIFGTFKITYNDAGKFQSIKKIG